MPTMSEQEKPPKWAQDAANNICQNGYLDGEELMYSHDTIARGVDAVAGIIAKHARADIASAGDRERVRELRRLVERSALVTALASFIEDKAAHPKFESDGNGGIQYYLTERDVQLARKLLESVRKLEPKETKA